MTLTASEETARVIRDRLEARIQRVPEGTWPEGVTPWTDVPVITQADVIDVLAEPLPEVSDRVAELLAPGRVALTMECPECGQTVPDSMGIGVEFKNSRGKRSLKAAVKAVSVVHVCGQVQAVLDVTPGQVDAFPEDEGETEDVE